MQWYKKAFVPSVFLISFVCFVNLMKQIIKYILILDKDKLNEYGKLFPYKTILR